MKFFSNPGKKGMVEYAIKKVCHSYPPPETVSGLFCVFLYQGERDLISCFWSPCHAYHPWEGVLLPWYGLQRSFSGGHSYPLGYRNVIMDSPYSIVRNSRKPREKAMDYPRGIHKNRYHSEAFPFCISHPLNRAYRHTHVYSLSALKAFLAALHASLGRGKHVNGKLLV